MKKFLEFIKETPTAFHAAAQFKKILQENGFVEVKENELWRLTLGGKYYVGRNMSSLIAFVLPKQDFKAFHIAAAHLDSPTFKLKPNFSLDKGKYMKLNTEVYGGPIYSSWMDRPLGVAGRVWIQTEKGIEARLIQIKTPIACIPRLPIHYNRNVNQGVELNPQVDMIPLFGEKNREISSLNQRIADNRCFIYLYFFCNSLIQR